MPTNSEEEEVSILGCDNCGTDIEEGYENNYEGDCLCDGCYESRREDEERESDSEYISDHDYRPNPLFFNDNGRKSSQQVMIGSMPKIYFGIEIETEAMSSAYPNEGAELITDMCNGLVYCKHDGSLNNGFEIVTHPMSFGYVKNHAEPLWDSLSRLRRKGFRAWTTSTCGLHIHVSRNAFLSEAHLHKFMWFIYGSDVSRASIARRTAQESHIATIKHFAGRDSHWSKFDRESFLGTAYDGDDEYGTSVYVTPTLAEIAKGRTKKGNPIQPYANERYLALNRNNRHTLELRFFRPSLRPETVQASIEFVQCLFDYTEQVTSNQVINENALASFQSLGRFATTDRDKYSQFIARAISRGVFVDPHTPTDTSVDGEE
jgi:hypothetical protein